jgi:Rieske Fe-S protein
LGELQRDPLTRSDFLLMATLGTLVTATLTIPPAIFVLDPSIKNKIFGQSDIPNTWQQLGSIFDIPGNEPKLYRVSFPRAQGFALPKEEGSKEGSLVEAVYASWLDGQLPDILKNRGRGRLSDAEIEELSQKLNVVNTHCVHLGCPVRWMPDKGLIMCPCHGGEYSINGDWVGGPPPHGLYRHVFDIREDGGLFIKHEFTNGTPYVV